MTTIDKGLPKAMVKPNILTHVIEGYVIQEAGEPFAVNRPLRDWAATADREQEKTNRLPSSEEIPRKKRKMEGDSSDGTGTTSSVPADVAEPTPGTSKAADPPATEAVESAQPRVVNANKWTVAEVYEFIRKIPGCAGYAKEFLAQEVDGEALLLIKAEHLVMALSIKLGPALKIVACIDALRPENEQTSNEPE